MAVTVNDHDIVSVMQACMMVRLEPEVPTTTDRSDRHQIRVQHIFRFRQMRRMVKQRTEGSSFDAHVGAEQFSP